MPPPPLDPHPDGLGYRPLTILYSPFLWLRRCPGLFAHCYMSKHSSRPVILFPPFGCVYLTLSCSAINSYRLRAGPLIVRYGTPMPLSPQSAVVTTHRFLSAQPEEQKNRIKALYYGVVRLLLKISDTRPRSGDLRNRWNSCTQYLSSISQVELVWGDSSGGFR